MNAAAVATPTPELNPSYLPWFLGDFLPISKKYKLQEVGLFFYYYILPRGTQLMNTVQAIHLRDPNALLKASTVVSFLY